ncbi:MAG: energy-coupling factor transporter ATPase [Desulfotomaculum sp.]|nr:energy-coupling factor transporter ATPase [Desulfotomaculum sp.]
MWAVEVNNLYFTHATGTPFEQPALIDISFKIAVGQTVGIIGPTGSGKSTLIQHFNGLVSAKKGTLKITGRDIAEKKERKQLWSLVGMVFQYPDHQLFAETVYEDIAFGPKNLGLDEQQIKNRVIEALQCLALPESVLELSPLTLSGGMKRRVAIAGVLAMRPQILVLDEPTAGMEPVVKKQFLQNIKRIQNNYQMTVILVTHEMDDVYRIADQLIVLNQGKLMLAGTPQAVFEQAQAIIDAGLALPLEVQIMLKLKQRKLPVRSDVIGLDEAVAEIVKVKSEKLKTKS